MACQAWYPSFWTTCLFAHSREYGTNSSGTIPIGPTTNQAFTMRNEKAQMTNERSKVKNKNDESRMQECSGRLLPSAGFRLTAMTMVVRGGTLEAVDSRRFTISNVKVQMSKTGATNENHPHLSPHPNPLQQVERDLPSRARSLPLATHNSPSPSYLKRGTSDDSGWSHHSRAF
jgi:hypothetical protein